NEDNSGLAASFAQEKHLPCFIHTFVLCYKGVICKDDSNVYECLNEAKRLVGHFSRSSKATERLIEICGKKLIMPAKTRWNYHYHMLNRLLELKQSVIQVCDEL